MIVIINGDFESGIGCTYRYAARNRWVSVKLKLTEETPDIYYFARLPVIDTGIGRIEVYPPTCLPDTQYGGRNPVRSMIISVIYWL